MIFFVFFVLALQTRTEYTLTVTHVAREYILCVTSVTDNKFFVYSCVAIRIEQTHIYSYLRELQ